VLDASAAASWLTPGQRTQASEALLDEAHLHTFEAPYIFPGEVRALMLRLERGRRFDAAFTARAIASLAVYDIAVDSPPGDAEHDVILDLARREGLSMYDAIYFRQAMRGGVTLATRDGGLVAATQRHGIPVRDLS